MKCGAMARLFGEKLKYLRFQSSFIQAELARNLGISRSYLNNLEAGRKFPSLEIVLKVANLFKVTTDYLIVDDVEVNEPQKYEPVTGEPHNHANSFGSRLQLLRQKNKMTQVELTNHLGIRSQAHISLLENGQNEPSLSLILQLAKLFHVSTDYLLRDSSDVDYS